MRLVSTEYEQFIPEVNKLNLRIQNSALADASRVTGQDLSISASSEQQEKSLRYLNGATKRVVEKSLTFGVMRIFQGDRLVKVLAKKIEKTDPNGGKGIFTLGVGFFAGENDLLYEVGKVRTMVINAEDLREETFLHTTFRAGRDDLPDRDTRVLNSAIAKGLRRTGLDELPQVSAVVEGEMSLIGLRAQTRPELEGTRILWHLRNDESVSFDGRARSVLEDYPEAINRSNPKPAVFGMLSALYSKDTPHMVRLWMDMEYLKRASLLIDMRLLLHTLVSRQLRGKGAR